MRFEIDFLIAKEYDLVLSEGLVELFDLAVGERLCQIDIADFCADVWRKWCRGDGLESHEPTFPQ
jgi:hypothetical protein